MLVLLLIAVGYAAFAISELRFLSASGRIGPGFFPQIIGVSLVVLCLYSAIVDLRGRREDDSSISENWGVVAAVGVLSAVLILASYWLGALPGMVIFMLLALSVLNRGRHVQNLVVGVLLPLAIFSLFRYSLNATMPQGFVGIPI